MYTVEIEGQPFTMFYDIDQLENNRISGLTDAGKIEWLDNRVQILLARPATSAFIPSPTDLKLKERILISLAKILNITIDIKSEFYLTRTTVHGPGNLVVGMFSILLNGIEALGSFITPASSGKGDNFRKYIREYMPMWDITVSQTTLYGSSCSMVDVLWKHFRNGIAHGFIIEKGGLDFSADSTPLGYLVTTNNFLHIGPRTFVKSFNSGLLNYFDDVRNNVNGKRVLFIQNFNRTYPN